MVAKQGTIQEEWLQGFDAAWLKGLAYVQYLAGFKT